MWQQMWILSSPCSHATTEALQPDGPAAGTAQGRGWRGWHRCPTPVPTFLRNSLPVAWCPQAWFHVQGFNSCCFILNHLWLYSSSYVWIILYISSTRRLHFVCIVSACYLYFPPYHHLLMNLWFEVSYMIFHQFIHSFILYSVDFL